MSAKFSIGDEVRITTLDRRSNGKTGVIVGYEPNADCPYIVEFDSAPATMPSLDYEWTFIESELALADTAQQPPASAQAAPTGDAEDSGYTELIDTLDGRIKALERERDALLKTLREIESMGYQGGVDSAFLAARAGTAIDRFDPDPERPNRERAAASQPTAGEAGEGGE